jgi:hypothetical protein
MRWQMMSDPRSPNVQRSPFGPTMAPNLSVAPSALISVPGIASLLMNLFRYVADGRFISDLCSNRVNRDLAHSTI